MKIKKIIIIILVLTIILSSSLVFASTGNLEEKYVISSITKERIYKEIEEQLIKTYGDKYSFENFCFYIGDMKLRDGEIFINIDVNVDMMLIKSYKENKYFLGVLEGIKTLKSEERKIVKCDIVI